MSDTFFKNDNNQNPSGEIPHLTDNQNENTGTKEGFSTEEGRMAAIMAYIPFLCFIPLLNMRDNKEAQFHARQGVILFLIEVVASIFLIDFISDMVFTGILMVALALSVVGIYFGLQGKNYRLPVIADLADRTKDINEK